LRWWGRPFCGLRGFRIDRHRVNIIADTIALPFGLVYGGSIARYFDACARH